MMTHAYATNPIRHKYILSSTVSRSSLLLPSDDDLFLADSRLYGGFLAQAYVIVSLPLLKEPFCWVLACIKLVNLIAG